MSKNLPDSTTTLSTIGELRNIVDPLLTSVKVLGYYDQGDGGGGRFITGINYGYYKPTTPDNGGTVLIDSIKRRWVRVIKDKSPSPKWFGAVGDGETDDSGPVQNMINWVWDYYDTGTPMRTRISAKGSGKQTSLGKVIMDFNGCIYAVSKGISNPLDTGGGDVTFKNGTLKALKGFPSQMMNSFAAGVDCGVFNLIGDVAVWPFPLLGNVGTFLNNRLIHSVTFKNFTIDCNQNADIGISLINVYANIISECRIIGFRHSGVYMNTNNNTSKCGGNNFEHLEIRQQELRTTASGVFWDNQHQSVKLLTGIGLNIIENDARIIACDIINVKYGIVNGGGGNIYLNNHIWAAHMCMISSPTVTCLSNYFDTTGIWFNNGINGSTITGNVFTPATYTASILVTDTAPSIAKNTIITGNKFVNGNKSNAGFGSPMDETATLSALGSTGDTITIDYTVLPPAGSSAVYSINFYCGLGFLVYEKRGTGTGIGWVVTNNIGPTVRNATLKVLKPFSTTSLTSGNWFGIGGLIVLDTNITIDGTFKSSNNASDIIGGPPILTDYGCFIVDHSGGTENAVVQHVASSTEVRVSNGQIVFSTGSPKDFFGTIERDRQAIGFGTRHTGDPLGAIVLGNGCINSGNYSAVYGRSSTNSSDNSVLIGTGSFNRASSGSSVVLGQLSDNTGTQCVVTGYQCVNNANQAIVVGRNCVNSGFNTIIIGNTVTNTADGVVRIGASTQEWQFSSRLTSYGTTPVISGVQNVGTGGTIVLSTGSSDIAGRFTITTGSTGTIASGTPVVLATWTSSAAYKVGIKFVGLSKVGDASRAINFYVTSLGVSTWNLSTDSVLAVSSSYSVSYFLMG